MTALSYDAFLETKAHTANMYGHEPGALPAAMFDFQRELTGWAIRKGRAAIFADCGLGKTLQELAWGDSVVRQTNRPVLLLAPLAVAPQTVGEAEKFGIDAVRSRDGSGISARVIVTNYERLHNFDPDDFAGVICDESSILKSFEGARRNQITEFLKKVPYRLLATATAAPNDYVELGTSSEALGELGYMDMLGRFFKNDLQNASTGRGYLGQANTWRFKGHAEIPFWRWVSSWARAIRKPSDFGFADGGFVLPPLLETEHFVASLRAAEGEIVPLPAVGLAEQREELRRTLAERCERAASLVADTGEPALLWCHLNDEGDRLASMIPGAVQVSGSDSDEAKEEKFLAFVAGEARVLVTKPKIGAWGLNFQHCAHVVYFPSHSFEQYYQAVRRCWRFGQVRPVRVDLVVTDGQRGVLRNLQRKSAQADRMFDALIQHMTAAVHLDRARAHLTPTQVPAWL